MQDIKDFIIKYADYFTFASFVLAVIAIYIAFLFYKKSKKSKRLTIYFKVFPLVETGEAILNDLEIKYKGQLLPNFSIIRLILENTGNEEIRKNDIPNKQPLTIFSENESLRFIDSELKYTSKDSLNPNITLLDNKLKIEFDFLNPKDELIFYLTCNSATDEFEFEGELIGEEAKVDFKKSLSSTIGMSEQLQLTRLNRKMHFVVIALKVLTIIASSTYLYFKNPDVVTYILLFALIFWQLYTLKKSIYNIKKFYSKNNFEKNRILLQNPLNPKYNKKINDILDR